MSMIDQFTAALDRALRYRRQLAIDAGHPPGNLDELITGDIFTPDTMRPSRRRGWLTVGRIHDEIAGAMLEVFWQPETDRVQIARPLAWQPPAPPALRPIGYNEWRGGGQAEPGYVYTLDGVDYTADEARRLVRADNRDRWTWRRVDGEESCH